MGANARYISPEARAKLQNYAWPGNVRELENMVLRAALLAPANTVRADDIELGRGGARLLRCQPRRPRVALTELIARRIAEMIESNGRSRATSIKSWSRSWKSR